MSRGQRTATDKKTTLAQVPILTGRILLTSPLQSGYSAFKTLLAPFTLDFETFVEVPYFFKKCEISQRFPLDPQNRLSAVPKETLLEAWRNGLPSPSIPHTPCPHLWGRPRSGFDESLSLWVESGPQRSDWPRSWWVAEQDQDLLAFQTWSMQNLLLRSQVWIPFYHDRKKRASRNLSRAGRKH